MRELTYFEEVAAETKAWPGPLKELLLEMKGEVERVTARDEKRLATERLAELVASYDRLVADGLRAEPPPEVPEQVRKQAPRRTGASSALVLEGRHDGPSRRTHS